MGSVFSGNMDRTLTESQKLKAISLGISEAEMIDKIVRIQNREKVDISIIIPVYNGEKFIKECVESALNQTYLSKEIIVVDDGSTDGTLDILTQIEDITVLIKPNGGTASALNTGIRNAKGNWIKWLSADDVLLPNYLDVMTDHIINSSNIKEKIYYCDYDVIDETGSIKRRFTEPISRNNKSNKEQFEELMKYYYGNGSSSMIHKDIFHRIGLFDEKLGHSEDYEFWLRASKNGIRFELVPQVLLRYREHKDQLTKKVGGSLDMEIKKRYV